MDGQMDWWNNGRIDRKDGAIDSCLKEKRDR